jgi:hypothetical protein
MRTLTPKTPVVLTVKLTASLLKKISPIILSAMQACDISDLCIVVGDSENGQLDMACFGSTSLHERIAIACLNLTIEKSMPIGLLRREYPELAMCTGLPICDGESCADGGIVVAAAGSGSAGDVVAIAKTVLGFMRSAVQEAADEFRQTRRQGHFIS